MIGLPTSRSLARLAAVSLVCLLTLASPVRAQVRGLYTPGMSATSSGELPEAGLTYVAAVQVYSFDELKGADGEPLPVNRRWTCKLFATGGYTRNADQRRGASTV